MQVKYTLSIGLANAKQEAYFNIPEDLGIDEEEWNKYSTEQKNDLIEDDYSFWQAQYLDGGWEFTEVLTAYENPTKSKEIG